MASFLAVGLLLVKGGVGWGDVGWFLGWMGASPERNGVMVAVDGVHFMCEFVQGLTLSSLTFDLSIKDQAPESEFGVCACTAVHGSIFWLRHSTVFV